MVSNNVWVEATVHPDSVKQLDLGWYGIAEPLDRLHVTMAFTTLKADELGDFDQLSQLRNRLGSATLSLPNITADYCEFPVNGASILQPGKGDFGVLLINAHVLWSYHTALARELTKDDTLDLTYPGWLPHITLCEGVTNYHDIEVLYQLAAKTEPIKLDGLWLRAGRMCLPL